MTADIVRFHDWIVDKNEIEFMHIETDPGVEVKDEFDKIDHYVLVTLKSGQEFKLKCRNLYHARQEMDFFTAKSGISWTGESFHTSLVQQVYFTRDAVRDLEIEIKRLMKSYKKLKDKK